MRQKESVTCNLAGQEARDQVGLARQDLQNKAPSWKPRRVWLILSCHSTLSDPPPLGLTLEMFYIILLKTGLLTPEPLEGKLYPNSSN